MTSSRKPRPADRPPDHPQVLAVLDQLVRRGAEQPFADAHELSAWLREQKCALAPLAGARRNATRLEQTLQTVRLATEQARSVVEAAGGDDLKMNEALMRLVQQHLFGVLVNLKKVNLKNVNLASLARSAAELGRASIMQQKFAEELRVKVAQRVGMAEHEVIALARDAAGGGLSAAAEAQIRRALTEITE